MQELFLPLSQGRIAYWDTKNHAPIILFIHGNSACKEIFLKQFFLSKYWDIPFISPQQLPQIFDSALIQKFRLVALDLLGNGHSTAARNPKQAYSYVGIAATIQEFLLTLYNKEKSSLWLKPIIIGWSLGGHAAIELINPAHFFYLPAISGIILCGTPPLDLTMPSKRNKGFLVNPMLNAMKNSASFSHIIAQKFLGTAGIAVDYNHYFITCAELMDYRARTYLQQWKNTSTAKSINQISTVSKTSVPIALFTGRYDICIDNHYLEQLHFAKLWRNKIHYFNSQHAPFWQQPIAFNQLLTEFAREQFFDSKLPIVKEESL